MSINVADHLSITGLVHEYEGGFFVMQSYSELGSSFRTMLTVIVDKKDKIKPIQIVRLCQVTQKMTNQANKKANMPILMFPQVPTSLSSASYLD